MAKSKLKAHPYAGMFPMMTDEEMEALVEDVRANGLRQPIVLYGGAILDGRNRLAACEKAEVEPQFKDFEGDDAAALALVVSLNVQRRDLTAGQRAFVAVRMMPPFEEEARKREKAGKTLCPNGAEGNSRDQVARLFKVGKNQVQQAKALLENAPDLAARVESRATSITRAYEEYQQRVAENKKREREAQRIAEFRDAVANGEMTMEEALSKVVEAEEEKRSDKSARQGWLEQVEKMLQSIEKWIADHNDSYLAWYTKEGEEGTESDITHERIVAAIEQLQRLANISFPQMEKENVKNKSRRHR